tara:strand:+ start:4190 stop:4519 length:330 start_codon:yes stop_codon:yes gene_type:complete
MAMEPQQMAPEQMAMEPQQMAPEQMQQDPMQDPRAVEALMQPSQEIQAVLVSRLSNMSPEDLQMLDTVITPEVARILVRLLPELQELIDMANNQQPMPEEEQMGALSGM